MIPRLVLMLNTCTYIGSLLLFKSDALNINNYQDLIGNETEDRNIYILLLGLSGSGKSSTINTLLNTNIAAVGNTESTTSEIFEYSLGHPGILGTELRLIDTPGFEDTRGLEKDAEFLATLEEFLNNHDVLSHRPPDIVLICSRFDDNRFHGIASKFVKMLKSVGLLQSQLVNPQNSNLIFVLTHLMSVDDKQAKNPESKLKSIENTIKEFSLFPEPIKTILAENKGEDNELERVGIGYRLPNGELYPQNLCSAIKTMLSSTEQKNIVKIQLMNSVCSEEGVNSTTIKWISETSLVPTGDLRAAKLLEMLIAANLNTEDTEISRYLKTMFEKMPGKENLPPGTLLLLQKGLHLRHITKLSDIPRTDIDIASLFRDLHKYQGIEIVFKWSFGIQPPQLRNINIIGNCYNTISDSVLETNPFKLDAGMTNLAEVGFLTPSSVTLTVDSQTKYFYQKSVSENEYVNNRFLILGVQKQPIDSICKSIIKPGFNIISWGSCPSLLIEFRTSRFNLNTVELNTAFLSNLESLPEFNISIPNSIQKWRGFFGAYGGHVITSAFSGGSIEVIIENQPCNGTIDPKDAIEKLISEGDRSLLIKIGTSKRLKFSGGDPKYYAENPDIFFSEKGTKFFEKWKESLNVYPAILHNDFKLKPLKDIIPLSKSPLINKMNTALQFFQGDKIDEHPLLTRLKEIAIEKSAAQVQLQSVSSSKNNLERNVEQLRKENSELEKQHLELQKEIMATKELQANTEIQLKEQRMSKSIQVAEIKALNNSFKELEKTFENEKKNSQSLQQLLKFSGETMATYQNKILNNRCGQTFNSERGVIVYKYFTEHANNERCVWIVRVPKTFTQIKFTKFETNLELGRDYITVYSFDKEGLKQGYYLGKDTHGSLTQSVNGSVAVVVFTSDHSVVNKGFILEFTAVGNSERNSYDYYQDHIYSTTSGYIRYPAGSEYHHNELSLFVISNSFFRNSGTLPSLKVQVMKNDLEKCGDGDEACTCDRLILYHMEKDHPSQRMRYCGKVGVFQAPDLFIFVFGTDGSVSKTGFEIKWSLA